ncbi:MAG: hypothetical protein WBN96_06680, partial [Gammaproteobacteria bacterium]
MAVNNCKLRIALVGIGLTLLIFALLQTYQLNHQKTSEIAIGPLPQLGSAPVQLRVAHVVNPRFPLLTTTQLSTVLSKTQTLAAQYFKLQLEFDQPQPVSIEDFFALRNRDIESSIQENIVNPLALTKTDRDNMRKGVFKRLSNYTDEQEKVANYARPYLTVAFEGNDLSRLSNALVDT